MLAVAALAEYDLKEPVIAYHGYETNLFYRVTSASGERFMLRLASPGWRTLVDLESEAMWLNALSRDTSIPVPRVVPATSGEYVLPMRAADIPDIWNVTLMRWLPGRLLGRYLTPHGLENMGRLFAGLHHHGAIWDPPPGFTTRRFEHWLSRGEENLITGKRQLPIPSQSRQLLERMHSHVEESYAAIDRSDLRVIHCDLWHDNIKLHNGTLHPFDFEDTVWGFRIHDIAMAMLDLLEDTGEERYPGLIAAFRRGYESQSAWPNGRIEPFQIGRLLWKINWIARNQPHSLESMIERHIPVFAHYEKTGDVILPA